MSNKSLQEYDIVTPEDTDHIRNLFDELNTQMTSQTQQLEIQEEEDVLAISALKSDSKIIKDLKKTVDKQTRELDLYKLALITKENQSAEKVARTEFQRAANDYVDKIREYDIQDRLIDNENDKLTNLELKFSEQEEDLIQMENNINIHNRSLYYDQVEMDRKNRLIWLIRNSAMFWLGLILLFIFYKCFVMFKDSIIDAVRKHLVQS